MNPDTYLLENMQTKWLSQKQWIFRLINGLLGGLVGALIGGLLIGGLIFIPLVVMTFSDLGGLNPLLIIMRPRTWIVWLILGPMPGLGVGLITGLVVWLILELIGCLTIMLMPELSAVLILFGWIFALIFVLTKGLSAKTMSRTTYPGQRISSSMIRSFFIVILLCDLISGLTGGLIGGLIIGAIIGLGVGIKFGGGGVIQHYALRFIIAYNNLLPWRLVPFLDYATERIFLRKVGGRYIFVHRLLMEHFAAMYPVDKK